MYPGYRGMNSYPYQVNQMPSAHYYYPSWESVPPQTKEDQQNYSCMHDVSPQHCSYSAPIQCHSFCSHGQHPAYYNIRPPCSHFPPPPPTYNHFCGAYPPYPQYHPMYYPSPPHYSMELPRYDYGKNVPGDQFHCCGFSNQQCHAKGRNNVKIEEQEPDVETKKGESCFPVSANNFQYPILWIPPEYTNNNEQLRKLVENGAGGQQVLPYVKKPQAQRGSMETEAHNNGGSPFGRKFHQSAHPAEQDLNSNGWIPLDMNSIKQLMQGGNAMQSHEQGNRSWDVSEGSLFGRKPCQSVQSVEQEPNFRNGWFPLDMNRIKQLIDGRNATGNHDQDNRIRDENKAREVEDKDQFKQSSYPIVWIPNDGGVEDNSNSTEGKASCGINVDESPSGFEVAPMKIEHTDNEAEEGKTTSRDDDSMKGTLEADKKRKVKVIPVKQLEDFVDKLSKEADEHKVDRAPASKESQDSAKNCASKQSSLATKKSKLPPICLRVDPPKKKNGNGSMRSPSPPGNKNQQALRESSLEGLSNKQPINEIKVKDLEEKPHKQNSIEVSHGEGGVKEGSDILKDEVTGAENNVMHLADKDKSDDGKSKDDKVQAQESQAAREGESLQESKQDRRVMSDREAAVVIQSAYRGYSVRRWEPLKKIKQITEVHEEAIRVKRLVEDLQYCASIEDKEKVAIGETIMNLLLKLDTIQGLHVSIRDIRRSVAKELVMLQEKLDSIVSQKSIPSVHDTSAAQEEPSKDTDLVERAGEASEASNLGREKGTIVSEEEGISSNEFSSSQLPCQDVMGSSENKNTAQESAMNYNSHRGPQDEIVVSPAICDGDIVAAGLDLDMKENPGASENIQGQSPVELQESSIAANSVEDSVMQTHMVSRNKDQEVNLPQEVVKEPLVTIVPVEDTAMQSDLVSDIQDEEEKKLLELPLEAGEEPLAKANSAEDIAGVNAKEDRGAEIVSELPIKGVEEDGKETPLAQRFMGSTDVPTNECNELSEVQTSGNLNNDQEDQPSERVDVENENKVVEQENQELLEISSKEILSSLENNGMPENKKLQESTGDREIFELEPGAQVEEVVEVPLKEFKDEVQNVENSSTESLVDPLENNEDIKELLAGDQENESEIVRPELPKPDVQQFKEEDGSMGLSSDNTSFVVGGDKDEQIDQKLIEENAKLREMLEKLLASGKEQQEVISNLNGKVKDLEKKLTKKKKMRSAKHPRVCVSRPSHGKVSNGSPDERSMGMAP